MSQCILPISQCIPNPLNPLVPVPPQIPVHLTTPPHPSHPGHPRSDGADLGSPGHPPPPCRVGWVRSPRYLDNVTLGHFPTGGDADVVPIQLHHGWGDAGGGSAAPKGGIPFCPSQPPSQDPQAPSPGCAEPVHTQLAVPEAEGPPDPPSPQILPSNSAWPTPTMMMDMGNLAA